MAYEYHTTSADSSLPHHFPRKDLTGQRFGRLLVLGFAEYRYKQRNACWHVLCNCGTSSIVSARSLLRGLTISCGCYRREQSDKANKRHGQSKTPLHWRWALMHQRCTNTNLPGYKDYGGRGIRVCERWHTFENFAVDMGQPPPGTTLERRDNNGHYCKENCYWGSLEEQANNKRTNRLITFQGRTQTLAQWIREKGLDYSTIWARLKRGWPIEKALTTPVKQITYTI